VVCENGSRGSKFERAIFRILEERDRLKKAFAHRQPHPKWYAFQFEDAASPARGGPHLRELGVGLVHRTACDALCEPRKVQGLGDIQWWIGKFSHPDAPGAPPRAARKRVPGALTQGSLAGGVDGQGRRGRQRQGPAPDDPVRPAPTILWRLQHAAPIAFSGGGRALTQGPLAGSRCLGGVRAYLQHRLPFQVWALREGWVRPSSPTLCLKAPCPELLSLSKSPLLQPTRPRRTTPVSVSVCSGCSVSVHQPSEVAQIVLWNYVQKLVFVTKCVDLSRRDPRSRVSAM